MSDEQRSQVGCIARRMQRVFHHGLLDVENLWMARAKPVEKLTTKKYLWPDRGVDPTSGGMWTPAS
jgi:hypothetical protein